MTSCTHYQGLLSIDRVHGSVFCGASAYGLSSELRSLFVFPGPATTTGQEFLGASNPCKNIRFHCPAIGEATLALEAPQLSVFRKMTDMVLQKVLQREAGKFQVEVPVTDFFCIGPSE